MNKIIKRKLIRTIICFALGIACLIFIAFNFEKIDENLLSYLSGCSTGIITVGIITLIKYTRVMKNERMRKELENANNDERLKINNNESMAITFRIIIWISVIADFMVTFFFREYQEFTDTLSAFTFFSIFTYLIAYYFVSKNN